MIMVKQNIWKHIHNKIWHYSFVSHVYMAIPVGISHGLIYGYYGINCLQHYVIDDESYNIIIYLLFKFWYYWFKLG